MRPQDLEFAPGYVAIPTLGGIIVEEAELTAQDEARFPPEVRLPVSKAVAVRGSGWMVVNLQGRGVVVTALEARQLGLSEAPHWLPDLKGVSTVPAQGEIQDHLDRLKNGVAP